MTAKPILPVVPSELEEVALVDATVSAAIGGMKSGWWYGKVRDGSAPQPVIRAPRCTRWRLVDVREFWRRYAEQSAKDTATAVLVRSRAERASVKSRESRAAAKPALQIAA